MKNIYQRIAAVMQDVQYLVKDDSVEFGKTRYKAISEEKVTSTVRASMIKNGLVMYPFEQAISKEEQITTVNTRYMLVNVDNPEEQIVIASSGQGSDTQDKGSGKAMTYAFKYALLRSFMIPTGEDPDRISSAELDAKQGKKPDLPPPINSDEADNLRKTIYSLGGGDLKRINDFLGRIPGFEGRILGDLSVDELKSFKVALARAVAK